MDEHQRVNTIQRHTRRVLENLQQTDADTAAEIERRTRRVLRAPRQPNSMALERIVARTRRVIQDIRPA